MRFFTWSNCVLDYDDFLFCFYLRQQIHNSLDFKSYKSQQLCLGFVKYEYHGCVNKYSSEFEIVSNSVYFLQWFDRKQHKFRRLSKSIFPV